MIQTLENGTVTIPSTLGGSPVTSIGDSAFMYCHNLTSITIPNSVTTIGEAAFCGCSNLTDVKMSSSLTSIGGYAFDTCKSLKSVIIPRSVTNVGEYAFSCCTSLTNVTIQNRVKSIGTGAFSQCSSLESVKIPGSVTSIGDDAFVSCTSLTDVYYKGSSDNWANITIGKNNTKLTSANIYYSDECEILSIKKPDYGTINTTNKTINFKVPNSVTSITPEFELSYGATWKLYSDPTATTTLSKTINLAQAGEPYTYYIKVIAADGKTYKTYTITCYRNTKSISPVITFERDLVTISAENCEIYYTVDGSTPTTKSTKYTGVFSVPNIQQ